MIAKLENGRMVPCPKQGRDGRGGLHTNLPLYYLNNPSRGAEDGCYPVQYTARPEGDQQMSWALQDDVIVQVWTACEAQPQPEDPVLMRLALVENCLLEMGKADAVLSGKATQTALSQLWAQKIVLGEKTSGDVPRVLKDEVEQILTDRSANKQNET